MFRPDQLDRSIDITNPSLFRYAVLSCYIYVLELENISKDLGFTKIFIEMCIIEFVLLNFAAKMLSKHENVIFLSLKLFRFSVGSLDTPLCTYYVFMTSVHI